MSSCVWGISYGFVDKRGKKLLRRMVATPMNKTYYLLSQTLSRLILTLFDSIVLILFANLVFDTQIQGSIFALVLVFISGSFAFIGISVLIASRFENTQVANGVINAVTMPMMLLSGIFFSYYNFPQWFIPIIKYLPLTLFTDSVRSIFVEGAEIAQVFISVCILSAIGFVTFITGAKIFKWY